MSTLQHPIINGEFKSWANIETLIDGRTYSRYKSVKWDDKVEVADVYGAGPLKLGTTRGNVKPGEVTIEMYTDEADDFENALAAKAPLRGAVRQIGLVHFPLLIQFSDVLAGPISTVSISGCRIIGRSGDYSQGTDATVRPYTLNVMQILTQRKGGARTVLI